MRISTTKQPYILPKIARCLSSRGAYRKLGGSCFPKRDRILKKNINNITCDRHILNTDCDAAVKSNEGCGVRFSDPHSPYTSYGLPFNLGGGGYFAMYKGRDAVKIWSFPRRATIPPTIRDGVPRGWAMKPDPSWGDPDANFPFDPDLCDYKPHFDAHRIVFDLTFCVSILFTLLVTHG